MALPIGENVPTPRGSIFCVSRGSQLPYTKKIENSDLLYILLFNSRYTALAAIMLLTIILNMTQQSGVAI